MNPVSFNWKHAVRENAEVVVYSGIPGDWTQCFMRHCEACGADYGPFRTEYQAMVASVDDCYNVPSSWMAL